MSLVFGNTCYGPGSGFPRRSTVAPSLTDALGFVNVLR
jgi:hypothetical protein